jgi:hypothetical protein
MRFKTTIKLVSDANNKNEALDLVEEYLAGNIVSGVDMRCVTKPVYSNAKIAGVAVISLAIVAGIFLSSYIKHPQNIFQALPGVSAVQPPLKTSNMAHQKSSNFKEEWNDRQTKEALDQITQ